ncbi:hypothetical protein BC835DRAFT_847027 [Cytidiella melzeri]|nr:hypothetical protein BC835DRAFT_847027 [Cytidiella melzeri]
MLSFINRVSSRSSEVDVATKEVEEAEQPAPEHALEAEQTTDNAASSSPAAGAAELDLLPAANARPSVSIYSSDDPQTATTNDEAVSSAAVSTVPATQVSHDPATELTRPTVPPQKQRRLSFRPLSFKFLNSQDAEEHKHALSLEKEQKKKSQVAEDRAKRAVRVSSADKKAKESAVIVRSLIIGPNGIMLPNAKAKPVSKPKIEKVKSQLLNPKTANRVITQLRSLPSYAETLPSKENGEEEHRTLAAAVPIHAVCLPYTDTEADEKHFSKLTQSDTSGNDASYIIGSVYTSPLSQVQAVFAQIDAVSLFAAPNFGLGEPGDGVGILSGAIPTAKTVIDGIEQVTPQLMALGYATGKSILPDHTGIHPPTDRISVLTYWWGFELALPPPSIKYLSQAPSIAHSVINVLTALAAVNNGVREILPFVRYISQYVDAEFNMIKSQDEGKGVVCAATWLVPVALVPRPWDFTPAPIVNIQPAPSEDPDHAPETADPASPVQSPHMPPSRPGSPPSLLPPLELHSAGFSDTEEPAKVAPVDETPVDIDEATAAHTEVPIVAVVPPTPTASGISKASSSESERTYAA